MKNKDIEEAVLVENDDLAGMLDAKELLPEDFDGDYRAVLQDLRSRDYEENE